MLQNFTYEDMPPGPSPASCLSYPVFTFVSDVHKRLTLSLSKETKRPLLHSTLPRSSAALTALGILATQDRGILQVSS